MLKQPKTYEVNTPRLLVKFLAKLVGNVNKLETRIEQFEKSDKYRLRQIKQLEGITKQLKNAAPPEKETNTKENKR